MVVWQSLLWRGGGVAACAGRFLQDTHLDDWEVADETCVRPPDETVICRRASCQGLAACFMEPSKKFGLHLSHVDGTRIADLSAERTAEACSLVQPWETLSFSTHVLLSLPCVFRTSTYSSWHVPETGAPSPGYRQLVPIARPSAWSCIGRMIFRQWRYSSTISRRAVCPGY